MNNFILVAALSTLSLASMAESETSVSKDIELGMIATSGNTESTTLKGKFSALHDLKKTKNLFVIEGFYKEDGIQYEADGETISEDQVTAEKYFISDQFDFKIDSEHRGVFIFGSYEQDKFSGLDYQSTLAAGYTDRFFSTEKSYLDISLGPGIAFSKAEDTDEMDGETEQSAILRISFNFLYKLSENAKITQTFASDASPDSGTNSKTKAETAITASMTANMALKASFTIDQNTHPETGKRHADTQTAVTLVYSI